VGATLASGVDVTGTLAPRVPPVAITGAGVVTAIGQDLDAFWAGLVTGVSGISEIEGFPVEDLRVTRGGEIKKIRRETPAALSGGVGPSRRSPYCRTTRFLVHAAREALETAGLREALPEAGRVAVVVGTALGGIDGASRALVAGSALGALTGSAYDGPTRNLARWLGARGPVLTVTTACASGATSLGLGADLLRAGQADVVLAGGADVLCRFVQRGFNALRSLTRDAVRPFDRRRNGLLLGEGAGLVVLERADTAAHRGRPPIGHLMGHASTADGAHITAPDPEGRGLELAVRSALAEAGLAPGALDMVSAHGTGTPANDRVETAVLKRVLGRRAHAIPVNSIKAHLGHTMGAAATLEAIMCLLAGRHGQVPPTLNYGEADPDCDLDCVPNAARAWRPRVSLSTSLGFGGCNAALVLAVGEEWS
jgi:3-oxoacyl-[acyl-carrier-protein] synthase II